MAGPKFVTVDDYIASQPWAAQQALNQVRAIVRKALSKAEESISYNIPTYKLAGKPVIYFAGWKRHYSIYPVSSELAEALEQELASYEVNKGTVRFPLDQPIPVKLIAKMAKLRAKEVQARP